MGRMVGCHDDKVANKDTQVLGIPTYLNGGEVSELKTQEVRNLKKKHHLACLISVSGWRSEFNELYFY